MEMPTEPGIWAVKTVWREGSSLSSCRSRPQFFLDWSYYQGNHWIQLSWGLVLKKQGGEFAVLLMHHYDLSIFWPWMLINRGGGSAVKTVCMSIVFAEQVMGWEFSSISMYTVWGKSWTHGIGTLKRFLKTGCLFEFVFLLLILTDVLSWVLC